MSSLRVVSLSLLMAALTLLGVDPCAAQSRVAQARVQDFKAIDVDARLDVEGAMHVIERHEFWFTGDWNGGERVINIPAPFASFRLNALTRIDALSGQRFPLVPGDLSSVDQFQVEEQKTTATLRWRSRLPRDPSFDHTAFVYEIAYTIYGVLWRSGGGKFFLSHEFVPQRPGVLPDLRIRFAIDRAWHTQETLPDEWHLHDVQPTGTHVVQATLWPDAPLPPRYSALLFGFVAALLALSLSWIGWERRRGRLGSVAVLRDQEAAAWLEQDLLRYPAEEIAVTWSASPGAQCAVAALLARLELEHKITTHVQNYELELELLVDRQTLEGYERDLIELLFFAGNKTSTKELRSYYKRFRPGDELEPHLTGIVEERLGPRRRLVSVRRLPELILHIAGLSFVLPAHPVALSFILPIVLLFPLRFGFDQAKHWRSNPDWGLVQARWVAFWAVFIVVPVFVYVLLSAHLHRSAILELSLGLLLVALGQFKFVLGFASSHESARGSELRRRLKVIRQYLKRKLEERAAMPDAWVPYLFALGLTPEAYVWFGAESEGRDNYGSRVRDGSSGTRDAFAGAGGLFGGAGASGAWVNAVDALAAGSGGGSSGGSSSSSSSSGGSSSSSGGGSVGGW